MSLTKIKCKKCGIPLISCKCKGELHMYEFQYHAGKVYYGVDEVDKKIADLKKEIEDIEDPMWEESGKMNSLILDNIDIKKEIERLKEYANHKITCLIYRLNDPDEDCDCGLDDLLKDKE